MKSYARKLAPPLVTLLSCEPEIQYVALRNINLIVQKRPQILAREVKVFFCKYNDPIYVKLEKLEILVKLVSDANVDQVLLEFKEYAQEVHLVSLLLLFSLLLLSPFFYFFALFSSILPTADTYYYLKTGRRRLRPPCRARHRPHCHQA